MPGNAALGIPCWRDIDQQRVAIYFAGTGPIIDVGLLAGQQTGYYSNGSILFLFPAFAQRLQYNCTEGVVPVPPRNAVNATYTCIDWYRDNPVTTRTVPIPLDCLNTTYIFPIPFLVNTTIPPVLEGYCASVSSPVTGACTIVLLTNAVLCQCFHFQTAQQPTATPPTGTPTAIPTATPTAPVPPTISPAPTSLTSAPTNSPTALPTRAPTQAPTNQPTNTPTATPTRSPTVAPTSFPTTSPTNTPTPAPTPTPIFTGLSILEIAAIVIAIILALLVICLCVCTIVLRKRTTSMYNRQ